MSGELQMRVDSTLTTARRLAEEADGLAHELESIDKHWLDLSAKWIGRSGSAYEPAWSERYQDARTVAAILSKHAELLLRSAALLIEHQADAAEQLGSLDPRKQ
ncbi:WXG100 family type VII secretion target [Mycolicibacterium mengxianglii]|uniref:WXG100 family type VII secretion target n=1 Tax=Mycolicibacterium mengxianglii TaxID=2736649 RepID=UPI0018D11E27|nr:WXG100 family type VII secretion target [Mycolicibacterium mengxianglii]